MTYVQFDRRTKWSRIKWTSCIMIDYGLFRMIQNRQNWYTVVCILIEYIILYGIFLCHYIRRSFLTDPSRLPRSLLFSFFTCPSYFTIIYLLYLSNYMFIRLSIYVSIYLSIQVYTYMFISVYASGGRVLQLLLEEQILHVEQNKQKKRCRLLSPCTTK